MERTPELTCADIRDRGHGLRTCPPVRIETDPFYKTRTRKLYTKARRYYSGHLSAAGERTQGRLGLTAADGEQPEEEGSTRGRGHTGVDPEGLVGAVGVGRDGEHVGAVERARGPDGEADEGRERGLDEGELVVEAACAAASVRGGKRGGGGMRPLTESRSSRCCLRRSRSGSPGGCRSAGGTTQGS